MSRFIARSLGDVGTELEAGLELGCGPAVHVDVTSGLRPSESGIQGTFMAYAQRAP